MKKMNRSYPLILIISLLFCSCDQPDKEPYDLSEQFKNHWYAGKAEVASYDLRQARYGQIHDGNAVLIFVTEDFSREKHVKLDNPSEAGADKVRVMKLNLMKKFNTGIYPYSIMLSVFSPVDINNFPRPLKTGMSAQEWCGHVYTQMDIIDNLYQVQQFSYFESEGDKNFSLPANTFAEDEIWSRIRINYKSLPEGSIEMIPGLITSRLTHKNLEKKPAEASLTENESDTVTYDISYATGQSLSISFNKNFPHQIFGWEEIFTGVSGERLATTATLKDTLFIDYWNKNKIEHLYLRDSLGLE